MFGNSQAQQFQPRLTFLIIHAYVDWEYDDHPALAIGSTLADIWHFDNWRYMMDLIMQPVREYSKEKEIKILGDLGFEPKSQCCQANALTTPPSRFSH